jgi:hypothetical protein
MNSSNIRNAQAHTGDTMERRRKTRIEIKLPCRIRDAYSPSAHHWKETENISRNGLLIRWPQRDAASDRPQVGQRLTVDLKLPENPVFGERWLRFSATIVRVGQCEENFLVGLDAERNAIGNSGLGEYISAGPPSRLIH